MLDSYDLGRAKDLAVLLASELVTNAMRHSDGPAWMRLSKRDESRIRIGVWDSDPTMPGPLLDCLDPPPSALGAEEDRGLLLVRHCAEAWGAHLLPTGKLLWFEVGAHTAWI